ncbi:hypothetical protein CKAN_00232900 [Cinnamomum micranthum f. kanehirae]|uniref:Uncharacterized protein n=1 Tax=Cinnamomum micranthum f. kanehirae TaxID=337451 RepID=A0A443N681_9MAGN|nr:hypothetical protein CKAN_00232900 [Cinnamomum micranthum f. kanehirae]
MGMPSSLPTSIIVVANKSMIKAAMRVGGEEEEEEEEEDDDDIFLMASLTWDLERRASLCHCFCTCLCHLFSSLSHLLSFFGLSHQTPHSLLQFLSTNPSIFLIIHTQFHSQTAVLHQLKCIELLLCVQGPSQYGHTKPYAFQGRVPSTMRDESTNSHMSKDVRLWDPGIQHQSPAFGSVQKPIW